MKQVNKLLGILIVISAFLLSPLVCAQQTATAIATIYKSFVVDITVTDGGSGYSWAPNISIIGGGGSGAGAVATVSNGVVIDITVTNAGYGYTSVPQVNIASPSITPFGSALVLDLPLDGSVEDVGPNHFSALNENGALFVADRYEEPYSALFLNGINQCIALPYDARLYPDEFTLSLWVNFQGLSGALWRTSNPLQDNTGGHLMLFDAGQFEYGDINSSGYNIYAVVPQTTFNVGGWYQIVISRGSNSCAMYINGMRVALQTNLTPYVKPVIAPMTFGANQNFDASFFNFFPGTLDNIHLYNRALSDSEVLSLYGTEAVRVAPVLGVRVKTVLVEMEVTPGVSYQLESSSDLIAWSAEGAPFVATNTTAFQDVEVNNNQAFYRLLVLSP